MRGAPPRRRSHRGVLGVRRPARIAPPGLGHRRPPQPPPLPPGDEGDLGVQEGGHGAQGGEQGARGDAGRGARAAAQRERARRRQAQRLQRLPRRALRHQDAHLLPAHAPLLGRPPLPRAGRGGRLRRGLRRLLRPGVRVGAVPRAAAGGGRGRQGGGRRRGGDDVRVPAREDGGRAAQGSLGQGNRQRRGRHGGGDSLDRAAAVRVRRHRRAGRRPVRRGRGGEEEAARPLQRQQVTSVVGSPPPVSRCILGLHSVMATAGVLCFVCFLFSTSLLWFLVESSI